MKSFEELNKSVDRLIDTGLKVKADRDGLLVALKRLMRIIDQGYLVRDTSHDGEPGWAMKQLPIIEALTRANDAIKAAEAD